MMSRSWNYLIDKMGNGGGCFVGAAHLWLVSAIGDEGVTADARTRTKLEGATRWAIEW